MEVTIIGSGTGVPSLRRGSPGTVIRVGTSTLLLDSGPGTLQRMLQVNIDYRELDYLLYSHFHPDHTAELVPLIFATKYPDDNRRKTPLTLVAGRGFEDFFAGLKSVYGQWIEPAAGMLKTLELANNSRDSHRFKDFIVESAPVEHNEESIAYRVTNAGGYSVVYSGDTDYSENLVTLAKKADLLICESALPDDKGVKGHLTPSLAGEIATRAGVGKLVLTHFYPECDRVDIEQECRKTYCGALVLAEDLLRLEVGS
jgi:ribonuclease BN (tRNA processing enzyme)